MTAEIVSLRAWKKARFGYEFDCDLCELHVFAAVHPGRDRVCLACQEMGPQMVRLLLSRLEEG